MRIGVLALQGNVREHVAALTRLGAEAVEVRTERDLEGLEGIVLPGGESTTISHLLTTSGLFEPLAAALGAGLPAFGTCAGMVLLADEVLDGRPDQRSFGVIDVSVRRNAFGRQIDSFEAPLAVRGLDEPIHAVFIRAPFVEATTAEVEVLADVDGHPVLCRQGAVLVSSFHPELTDDDRLHQLFLESCAGAASPARES